MSNRKNKPFTPTRVFRHMFTCKDNVTVDVGRVMWVVGALSFIAISIFFVWKTGTFDPLNWAAGFAAVNAAGGASVKIKESTEPQHDDSLSPSPLSEK